MGQNSTSFFILRLLLTSGVGPTRISSILNWASKNNKSLEDIASDIDSLSGLLTEKMIDNLRGNEKTAAQELDQLKKENVSLISILDPEYPVHLSQRLGKKSPPLLFVLGNKKLLQKTSVGFCGSRKATAKGLEIAKDCADQIARAGVNIVSGYAAGVDTATHKAALECSGTTTIVLASGIHHFRMKSEFKDSWDWNRVAVISEFTPGTPWNVYCAMQRNSTICALSQTMILVEARSKSGSVAAGKTCLEMNIPLFIAVFEEAKTPSEGNKVMLEHGGWHLFKDKKTNRANVGYVLKTLSKRNNDSNPDKDRPEFHDDSKKKVKASSH